MNRSFRHFGLIATSIVLIICIAIITGSTLSLFTSGTDEDINIGAAQVKVSSKIENLATYSMDQANAGAIFANGGTATITTTDVIGEDGTKEVASGITLSKLTPGDRAEFDVVVYNHSNVNIAYQFAFEYTTNAFGEMLHVAITDNGASVDIEGNMSDFFYATGLDADADLEEGVAIKTFHVSVELDFNAGNEYQNLSETITFELPAIQANAATTNVASATHLQYTLDTFGKATLVGNIDLGDTPITVPAGEEVEINLNGYMLNANGVAITSNGNLTIVDETVVNTIALVADADETVAMINGIVVNNGTLNVEGGKIAKIENAGTTTVAGGTVSELDNDATVTVIGGAIAELNNDATVTVSAGDVTTLNNEGAATINGGNFATITNKGDMTINNANVVAGDDHAIYNEGTSLVINGGTFANDSADKAVIFSANENTVIGDGSYTNNNEDGAAIGGNVTVNNGAFVGGIEGEPVINGGAFDGEDIFDNINDEYEVTTDENGMTVVVKLSVAKVGDVTYGSVRAAIEAVENGGVIVLIQNINFVDEANAVNGNAVFYDGDKSFTIDLNGFTFTGNTSNVVFRFQKAEGAENTITIKNGTVIAGANSWSAISVGSSTETITNIVLDNLTVQSEKANDIAIRARAGSNFVINNCTVTAINGAGCIVAGGGNVELNNVTANQYGVYNWNSVVLGISGGAKMVVNSGSYTSDPEGNAKGNWVAYIMSSGGTLEINDGTFTGTVAETANASNACGLICADRAAIVNINGGTFNSNGAILDMRNNVGTLPNPTATIAGGKFSADPTVSGLYSSNLISVAAGSTIVAVADGFIAVNKELTKVSDGLYTDDTTATKDYFVSNAEGLATLNAMMANKTAGMNVVVVLLSDIDFAGKTWTPVEGHFEFGFCLAEFDGNGHTIYNLTINGQAMFTRFVNNGETVTFKNITFDNANVTSGTINTAIIVAHTYQDIVLDNVDVRNSTIIGGYKVGTLIGTVYNEGASTVTATIKNCDIDNCTVKTTSYDFGTCGFIGFVYVGDNDKAVFENSTISNTTLCTSSPYYDLHAFIYYDGGNCIDEVEGVTVTNCVFEKLV